MRPTANPIASFAFWRVPPEPEAVASSCASASCYLHSEDVGVVAVVIFELTFCNIERQIFVTDLVIRADNRPLKDRPETFNRLSVHRADNVLLSAVFYVLMRVFAKALVGNLFIGCQQANLGRNSFAHKFLQVDCRQGAKHAGYNAALALDCADDGGLEVRAVLIGVAPLGFVLVEALAADERFVHL